MQVISPLGSRCFLAWADSKSGSVRLMRLAIGLACFGIATLFAMSFAAPLGDSAPRLPLPFDRIEIAVEGAGLVVNEVNDATCRGACAFDFRRLLGRNPVSLRAVPRKGWRFGGWGGGCAGELPV